MKAYVSPLYKDGKRLPHRAKLKTFEGDLNVSDRLHPVLGRLVKEACLVGVRGLDVISPMIDVAILGIYGFALRLRGIEFHGAREQAQEWWVRFDAAEKQDITNEETKRGKKAAG